MSYICIYMVFDEFKIKKVDLKDASVTIRTSKKDKAFMKKKGISPTMIFRSKLEKLKKEGK